MTVSWQKRCFNVYSHESEKSRELLLFFKLFYVCDSGRPECFVRRKYMRKTMKIGDKIVTFQVQSTHQIHAHKTILYANQICSQFILSALFHSRKWKILDPYVFASLSLYLSLRICWLQCDECLYVVYVCVYERILFASAVWLLRLFFSKKIANRFRLFLVCLLLRQFKHKPQV